MRNWQKIFTCLFAVGLCIYVHYSTQAQVCKAEEPQLSIQYFRKLSLDLRGHLPSLQEYKQIASLKNVPDSLIDTILSSKHFYQQIRNYHKNLLWPNIDNVRLFQGAWRLRPFVVTDKDGSKHYIYDPASVSRQIKWRGSPATCINELAPLDNPTKILKEMVIQIGGKDVTVKQEGYVWVKPYWDTQNPIRVCAFASQSVQFVPSPTLGQNPIDCSKYTDPRCGCGPNLLWCGTSKVHQEIRRSFIEQSLKFVEKTVKDEAAYTSILTSKSIEINGPISHYFQNFRNHISPTLFVLGESQNYEVPKIPYAEKNNWVKVERGTRHAGILTMPLYLIRFASNRGRAHQFLRAFMCGYFPVSSTAIPPGADPCHREPDLKKRCGCNTCHSSLEPMAAYWGRWAENGLAALNENLFPKKDTEFCVLGDHRYNTKCKLFYFTNPTQPAQKHFRGLMLPYLYATPQIERNIKSGPLALAKQNIENGGFAECTVKKVWDWLLGKPLSRAQNDLLIILAEHFKNNQYNFKKLVKKVIQTPEYKLAQLAQNK